MYAPSTETIAAMTETHIADEMAEVLVRMLDALPSGVGAPQVD